jgi:predicted amidohydrolase YtcJ
MKRTQLALGEERAKQQYPIKTMMESGASICFGSDFPVTYIFRLEILIN